MKWVLILMTYWITSDLLTINKQIISNIISFISVILSVNSPLHDYMFELTDFANVHDRPFQCEKCKIIWTPTFA